VSWRRTWIAATALLLVCAGAAEATPNDPPGSLSGTVVDGRTATPLPGVRVLIASCDVRTDERGAFTCPDLPVGTLPLSVAMLGYAQPDVAVAIVAGETTRVRVELSETTAPLQETVTVVGDRFATRDPATPGETSITSRDLFALRGVLADDPLRAVQAMPGVSSNDDFNADIVIRGIDPDRTALLIDGTPTRTAVHSLQGRDDTGSVSLVNSELLDGVTVAPGGRPLRSGGRSSGQVDFATRDGARSSLRARGIAGAAIASVVAEGPLGHANGGAGWMVAGRASYVGWIARRVEPDTTTTFVFGDVNAKLTWDPSPRHRVSLLALAGRLAIQERDDAPGINSLDHAITDSGFALMTSRWQPTPTFTIRHRVSWGADRFHNENAQGSELGRGRRHDLAAYHDTTWIPSASLIVEGGAVFERAHDAQHLFRLSTRQPFIVAEENVSSVRDTTGAHMGLTWMPRASVTLMAGARGDADSLVRGGAEGSGWVLGEWRLTDTWSARGGVTRLHQAPMANQVAGLRGNRLLPPEHAFNSDLLVSRRIGASWRAQVSAYRRLGDDEPRLPNSEPQLVNGRVRPASTTTRWDARLESTTEGLEFLVQRVSPARISGWVAYAYGRVRMHDRVTGERFSGDFDQRHGMNAYAAWRVSYRTAVVAKFRYGSNIPVWGYNTPVARDGDGTPLYAVGPIRNAARLPAYARLDLRVHRAFMRGARRFTLFGEALNVLNRTNWGPTGGRSAEKLFPVLPTAGLLIEW